MKINPGIMFGMMVVTSSVGLATDCLRNSTRACCAIVNPGPMTRGGCSNDAPGVTCSDILLANPTVPFVETFAGSGHKGTMTFPGQQACKWQHRGCNAQGHCYVVSVDVNNCVPSELGDSKILCEPS